MKKANHNTILKMILAMQAIVLTLVVIGAVGLMKNWYRIFIIQVPTEPVVILFSPTSTPTRLFQQPTSTSDVSEAVADMQIQELNISNANQVMPDDIFEEIAYYGAGGGSTPSCDNYGADGNYVEDGDVDALPNLAIPYVRDTKMELMERDSVQICGTITGEILKIQIIYPDGDAKNSTLEVRDNLFTFLDYGFALNDPVGIYTFIVSGQKGQIIFQINVISPPGPRLYHVDDQWIFYNFIPGEKIRVFSYSYFPGEGCPKDDKWCAGIFRPIYWQEYFVDSTGLLIINSKDKYIVGIGDIVGQVTDFYDYDWNFNDSPPRFYGLNHCPQSVEKSQNIQAGEMVVVAAENVWARDRGISKFIYFVPKGSIFNIKDSFTISTLCQSQEESRINYLVISCKAEMDFCSPYNDTIIPEGVGGRYFVQPVSKP
jgi:hypothetical protein